MRIIMLVIAALSMTLAVGVAVSFNKPLAIAFFAALGISALKVLARQDDQ